MLRGLVIECGLAKRAFMMLRRSARAAWLTALLAMMSVWTTPAWAQAWPARPIRILLGYTPGGANDGALRPLARLLETSLGQPIIIEYKPGAAGGVAAEAIAKAAPDGYTLYFTGSASITINPHLNRVSYNPMTSFTSLGAVCMLPSVLVLHPGVPAQSVAELVALTKREPGKWSYGSSGIAGPHHMAGEYFKSITGAVLQHVPYKGGAQAMNDLMGGQIPMLISSMGPAVGPVKTGRIRALAVTTSRRSVALPDVPTLDEAGLKGFDSSSWLGFVGPAGLPAEVVQRFSQAVTKAGEDHGLRDSFNAAGCEPEFRTPAQMRERITADVAKWGKLIKDANIKAD